MQTDCTTPRPKRHAVLIAIHPDGYVEAFAEKNIDVRFARIPAASNRASEVLAEDCFELMLPRRYRDLWRRDLLRANGSTAPLSAQAVIDALQSRDVIAALEPLMPPKAKKGAA